VDGLTVENISVINQRWWGITNVFVSNAVYRNIRFESDFSRIDEHGVHHPDETPVKNAEIYIRNADGIDLRIGCHHVLIENITGFTQDDSVALTALGKGEISRGMFVRGEETAIHDVEIKNVVTDCLCSNVRLLNGNGHKLYNIELDGIESILSDKRTKDHRFSNRNSATVRIGDIEYTSDHPSFDDTKNISIRNVTAETNCAITLCNSMTDVTIENVVANAGYAAVGTYRRYFTNLDGEEFAKRYNLVCETVESDHPLTPRLQYVHYKAQLRNLACSNITTVLPETVALMDEFIEIVE
jgi:DNA-binding protein Fis